MPIFECSKCHCVENTACSNYWTQVHPMEGEEAQEPLCSACDPEISKWHGMFDRTPAKGFILMSDGFLYSKEEFESGQLAWRMEHQGLTKVREIT